MVFMFLQIGKVIVKVRQINYGSILYAME
jgi:hypothetical protein